MFFELNSKKIGPGEKGKLEGKGPYSKRVARGGFGAKGSPLDARVKIVFSNSTMSQCDNSC